MEQCLWQQQQNVRADSGVRGCVRHSALQNYYGQQAGGREGADLVNFLKLPHLLARAAYARMKPIGRVVRKCIRHTHILVSARGAEDAVPLLGRYARQRIELPARDELLQRESVNLVMRRSRFRERPVRGCEILELLLEGDETQTHFLGSRNSIHLRTVCLRNLPLQHCNGCAGGGPVEHAGSLTFLHFCAKHVRLTFVPLHCYCVLRTLLCILCALLCQIALAKDEPSP